MKFLIILFGFVLFFGNFFLMDSNAFTGTPAAQEDPSLPEISMQLVLRNSDGMLVEYREPSIFFLRNVHMIHQYLDAQENKIIIVKDGINYEQIEFEFKFTSDDNRHQKTTYALFWDGLAVLTSRFNGYISEVGNTVTVSWKIVRTI